MKTTVDPKRMYQEVSLGGATPLELVIALYDAAIEDMRRALSAMQQNDIEARTRYISHALLVLQQLQGTLDFQRGGSAARQFEHFYNLVRAKLLEAQIQGSAELLRQQATYFCEVRECWSEVKHREPPVIDSASLSVGPGDLEKGAEKSEWSA